MTAGVNDREPYAQILHSYPPSFIDEILQMATRSGMTSFAGGLPDPTYFPWEELAWAFQKVLREQAAIAMQYNITEGYWPLREFIANRFSVANGYNIQPEQVLITHGAQQALDLVGRALIDPGDTVLVENPTFIGVLQAFAPSRPTYCTLDRENINAALTDFELAGTADSIRLFYTMPRFQNPTGTSYTIAERNQVLSVFGNNKTWIVEDDAYGELAFENNSIRPFICDLPHRSIYIGSFSKSIAPSLRTGWMIVPSSLAEKIAIVKRASDTYNSFIIQMAINAYLTNYNYDEHIGRIRSAYKERCRLMLHCMKEHFPPDVSWTIPQGGMFSWVTLPSSCDAMQFAANLLNEQLAVVPGKPFFVLQDKNHHLRLNFSNTAPDKIRHGIKRLGEILYSELNY